MMPLRIAVIGAGGHASEHHLPALAKYREMHAGEVELTAICDLNRERAQMAASRFGAAHVYTDVSEMLRAGHLDGVMAITPPAATLAVMKQVLEARVRVLIEKPPGVNVAEAKAVVEAATASGIDVMVSVNRRFDPVIAAGREWIGQRKLVYLRGTFVRNGRVEGDFLTMTAVHATDTIRFLAGERKVTSVDSDAACGGRWRIARIGFEGDVAAVLEICPTAGGNAETYEVMGEGFRVIMRSPFFDAGELACYEGDRLVQTLKVDAREEKFVRSGTYAETQAFVAALAGRGRFDPTPAQVLGSVELAWAVARGA